MDIFDYIRILKLNTMKKIYLIITIMLCTLTSFSQSEYAILDGGCGKDTIFDDNSRHSDTIYYCTSVQISVFGSVHDSIFWDFKYPDVFYSADSALCWFHDTTLTTPPDSTWFFNNGQVVKYYFIKKLPTSKICWVTVDSNFAHNVIIWDTTGFTVEGIDSVKIYYYYTATHLKLLATEPRISNLYYVDSVNNPNSGTFKYLLAGVNGCGNEDTLTSAWQTTAWIQQTGSTFTVSSQYTVKGNPTPVSYYILYRDTTGTGHNWDSIFETPGTILNDPNYANYPNAKYFVAAVLNMPGCSTPSIVDRAESLPANKSRSNRLNNSVTGIATVANTENFNVYPNPFINTFNLYLQKQSDVRVYNELGQIIFHSMLPQANNQVHIDGTPGLYMLNVNGKYQKIIKQQ